jgi:predicted DNA-binding protein with PD1-like motif
MKFQTLGQGNLNTFVIVFDKGDEFISGLTSLGNEKGLRGSHFTAIGAFRDLTLGYFDSDRVETNRRKPFTNCAIILDSSASRIFLSVSV